MRISKRNAAHIRHGITEGHRTLASAQLGVWRPVSPVTAMDELERRAYLRTLRGEFHRTARRALRAAKALKGED